MSDIDVNALDDLDYADNATIQQMRKTISDQAAQLKDLPSLQEQAAKAAELERQVAFHDANLPGELNERQKQAIIATAETQTADGLRKAAEELGFVTTQPNVNADDLAAHDRVAAASTGGDNTDPGNYEADLAAANNEKEVFAVMARYGRAPVTD